jgi:hypothetical protein
MLTPCPFFGCVGAVSGLIPYGHAPMPGRHRVHRTTTVNAKKMPTFPLVPLVMCFHILGPASDKRKPPSGGPAPVVFTVTKLSTGTFYRFSNYQTQAFYDMSILFDFCNLCAFFVQ